MWKMHETSVARKMWNMNRTNVARNMGNMHKASVMRNMWNIHGAYETRNVRHMHRVSVPRNMQNMRNMYRASVTRNVWNMHRASVTRNIHGANVTRNMRNLHGVNVTREMWNMHGANIRRNTRNTHGANMVRNMLNMHGANVTRALLNQERYLSSSLVADLQFREAMITDKAEVLSLRRNVYRGLDYLPDYYDFFIQDQNRRCIVGEIGHKIVSFGVMLTLDGGQSVLGQAGRVHERYEGIGFFSALSQYINQQARDSGCKQRVALVETTLNKYARSEKFRKTHVEIASKLHYAGIVTEDMRMTLSGYLTLDTQSRLIDNIDICELRDCCKSDKIRHFFFPQGRILVDYIPYRVMSENMNKLTGRNTRFFSNVKKGGSDVKGLLSAGTYYKCENPCESYTIDIFGEDVNSLEEHVLGHLSRAFELTSGQFCLQLFVEKGYVAQKLCETLIKHNIQKYNTYVEGGVSTKSIVEEPFI